MKKQKYILVLEYRERLNDNASIDARAERAVRRRRDGSGVTAGGVRDISWSYTQRSALKRAYDRLLDVTFRIEGRTTITTICTEDEHGR